MKTTIQALLINVKSKQGQRVEITLGEGSTGLQDLYKYIGCSTLQALPVTIELETHDDLPHRQVYAWCDEEGWMNGTEHGVYIHNNYFKNVFAGNVLFTGMPDDDGNMTSLPIDDSFIMGKTMQMHFMSGALLQQMNPVRQ